MKQKSKLQAESSINLRSAHLEDAPQIAPLMIEAGGGFYEFLFEGLGPEITLLQFLNLAISADKGPYSWKTVGLLSGAGISLASSTPFQQR